MPVSWRCAWGTGVGVFGILGAIATMYGAWYTWRRPSLPPVVQVVRSLDNTEPTSIGIIDAELRVEELNDPSPASSPHAPLYFDLYDVSIRSSDGAPHDECRWLRVSML
jgi:hypothetical protein